MWRILTRLLPAFEHAHARLAFHVAAESRAKIVPKGCRSLRFLMTREIAHFQMFRAALETIQPKCPPGMRQGGPHYTRTNFNMSGRAQVSRPA